MSDVSDVSGADGSEVGAEDSVFASIRTLAAVPDLDDECMGAIVWLCERFGVDVDGVFGAEPPAISDMHLAARLLHEELEQSGDTHESVSYLFGYLGVIDFDDGLVHWPDDSSTDAESAAVSDVSSDSASECESWADDEQPKKRRRRRRHSRGRRGRAAPSPPAESETTPAPLPASPESLPRVPVAPPAPAAAEQPPTPMALPSTAALAAPPTGPPTAPPTWPFVRAAATPAPLVSLPEGHGLQPPAWWFSPPPWAVALLSVLQQASPMWSAHTWGGQPQWGQQQQWDVSPQWTACHGPGAQGYFAPAYKAY